MLTDAEQTALTNARERVRKGFEAIVDLIPDNDDVLDISDLLVAIMLHGLGHDVSDYIKLVNSLKGSLMTSDPRDD